VPEYAITVERDGRFLLVHLPALNGVTQARFPGEVESMADDYIAVVTEAALEDIGIRNYWCAIPGLQYFSHSGSEQTPTAFLDG
jgi:hypothetical protein